jgi:hypothetical protein
MKKLLVVYEEIKKRNVQIASRLRESGQHQLALECFQENKQIDNFISCLRIVLEPDALCPTKSV